MRAILTLVLTGVLTAAMPSAASEDGPPAPVANLAEDVSGGVETVPIVNEATGPIQDYWLPTFRPRACDCCEGCPERLFGIVAPTDRCFNDFISPMTNIVHFEDPRTVTEIRPIFIHNRVPGSAGGGDVQLFAMHIRAALNERLSIVAAKDGYITSDNPLIRDGWADLSVGLKYNLCKDPCRQWIVSAGAAYEHPSGSTRSLQGNGDGEFTLYLTGGTECADRWHYVSTSGFRLPADTGAESQVWYWSHHVDRKLTDRWYGLVELNWYHWLSSGNGGLPGVEGVDLWNFGSQGVAGNDIVTMAVGTKFKPTPMQEVGVAWEFPVSSREDILDNRLYVDWIFRF